LFFVYPAFTPEFLPARFYPEEIPDAFAGVFAPGMVLAML